jgi:hypothetical protein
MFSPDDHLDPPPIPQFSKDMEAYLVASARTHPVRHATPVKTYLAVGVAAAAIAAGSAIGIDQAITTPHHSTANQRPPQQPNPANLAAYTVVANADGTVTLSLAQDQLFDPAALRQALANAGVPAIVTIGKVCYMTHPPQPYNGSPAAVFQSQQIDGRSVTTITPRALPAGSELSVGYFTVPGGGGVHIVVVPVNAALTCTAHPPAPPVASPYHSAASTRGPEPERAR